MVMALVMFVMMMLMVMVITGGALEISQSAVLIAPTSPMVMILIHV